MNFFQAKQAYSQGKISKIEVMIEDRDYFISLQQRENHQRLGLETQKGEIKRYKSLDDASRTVKDIAGGATVIFEVRL
jgi:hypothetical protein